MKYYTLLSRENKFSDWNIEFGDYDKDVVKAELESYVDGDYKKSNLKIICTEPEQYEIYKAVFILNGGS